MPGSRRSNASPPRARQVFLNVPYSRSYERLLVALTTSIVVLGRKPRLTFDLVEVGEGRLRRIREVMEQCQVSIHELGYATCNPARFNMPFELGLACALRQQTGDHEFHILESRDHRLQKTLSDLNGIDPKVHGRKLQRAIRAVLSILRRPDANPTMTEVLALHEEVWQKYVPRLRRTHGEGLFNRDIYEDLLILIRALATERGLI
jgi:hypothetical protein